MRRLFISIIASLVFVPKVFAIDVSQLSLGTSWKYTKIFSPSSIPIPDSAKNTDAHVKAVYSPSVVNWQGRYYMFFGVSIYCHADTVARDSIALAHSSDGVNWVFDKYIIEPDASTCKEPKNSWGDITFQLNDPAVIIANPSQLVVFYTTVRWPNDNYGNIGVAHVSKDMAVTFRNDMYVKGTNALGGPGFSRPDVRWISPTGTHLWFDSGGVVGSIPIMNFTQLDSKQVVNENIKGTDISLPLLAYGETVLLRNGKVIEAFVRNSGFTTWQGPTAITSWSGQDWDSWYQGSPVLYIDRSTCKVMLYFSGAKQGAGNTYESLSIGVATPPDSRTFSFPICDKQPFSADLNNDGVVNLLDYNLLLVKFGAPYTLLEYNMLLRSFGT